MSNKPDIDYTYLHDAKCRLLAYINPPDRQAEQTGEEIKRELHNAVYHHRDKWQEQIAVLKTAVKVFQDNTLMRTAHIAHLEGQIAALTVNNEFLSKELERLRLRVVLTPAESCLTMKKIDQDALRGGEEE